MRVGKFVEHIRAAAELYDASQKVASGSDQDNVLQYLQIVRQLGYAGYLTLDTLTVLDAAGIRKSAAAKRWQAQAYKAWFVGLMASVVAGGYANWKLSVRAREVDEKDPDKKVEGKVIQRYVASTIFSWPDIYFGGWNCANTDINTKQAKKGD